MPDADDPADLFFLHHGCHRGIQLILRFAALQDIGQDDRFPCMLHLAVQQIEGNGRGN